jgi:micrococcal nuclease
MQVQRTRLAMLTALVGSLAASAVLAHGGGLDDNGCHHDSDTDRYHCHEGPHAGESFASKAAYPGGNNATLSAGSTRATVREVVDGDTLKVRIDGQADTVRVLGIDTPEVHTDNTPDEFDPRLSPAHLRRWGKQASGYMRDRLARGDRVTLVFDPNEGRRGYYDRLLAYVELPDDADLGAALVENGIARVYEKGDAQRKPDYRRLERRARDACVGLWEPLC